LTSCKNKMDEYKEKYFAQKKSTQKWKELFEEKITPEGDFQKLVQEANQKLVLIKQPDDMKKPFANYDEKTLRAELIKANKLCAKANKLYAKISPAFITKMAEVKALGEKVVALEATNATLTKEKGELEERVKIGQEGFESALSFRDHITGLIDELENGDGDNKGTCTKALQKAAHQNYVWMEKDNSNIRSLRLQKVMVKEIQLYDPSFNLDAFEKEVIRGGAAEYDTEDDEDDDDEDDDEEEEGHSKNTSDDDDDGDDPSGEGKKDMKKKTAPKEDDKGGNDSGKDDATNNKQGGGGAQEGKGGQEEKEKDNQKIGEEEEEDPGQDDSRKKPLGGSLEKSSLGQKKSTAVKALEGSTSSQNALEKSSPGQNNSTAFEAWETLTPTGNAFFSNH
jgi:hypothetical protein